MMDNLEPLERKHPFPFRLARFMVRLAVILAVAGFAYTVYTVGKAGQEQEEKSQAPAKLSHEEEMVQLKGRLAVALERIDQLEAELAEAKSKNPQSQPEKK